jgi:hypothetical protein
MKNLNQAQKDENCLGFSCQFSGRFFRDRIRSEPDVSELFGGRDYLPFERYERIREILSGKK